MSKTKSKKINVFQQAASGISVGWLHYETRFRLLLVNTNSAPPRTSSRNRSPTSACSPSKPLRMSHGSTATNTFNSLPTTDGRTVSLPRHTQPEKDRKLLLDHLKLQLPAQPPPRITAAGDLAE